MTASRAAETYHEPFRPQLHFTPERNWMNDPNGMVFYDGEYHLFYQYNPFGDKWGHMSWGHAVSRDLVHWQHLPLALAEESGVMIFSGSAVVDVKNTSGLGVKSRPPLIAIYTGHYTGKPLQNQHIAYSNDRGRTWTKFTGNPVLDLGEKDFRDPKVFWHEPTQRWVMVVSWPVHRQVRFYSSPNLKQWTHLSDFGPAGSTTGIWECPDLFPVRIEGAGSRTKWVLIVNVGSGAPAGGSGCQYFVGDFDGTKFTTDYNSSASSSGLWADYGRDFYAAVSWSGVPRPDGRRLWLGWMSNWEYAQDVPTAPWRSAMSLPRELQLRSTPDGLRLTQQPVREVRELRGNSHRLRNSSIPEANAWLHRQSLGSNLLELIAEFDSRESNDSFGLTIQHGADQESSIAFDLKNGRVRLDRTRSGKVDFHPKFPTIHEAPLRAVDRRVKLHLFLDTSSVEAFVNDGEHVITDLIFPSAHVPGLKLFASPNSSDPNVTSFEIWELKSVWR